MYIYIPYFKYSVYLSLTLLLIIMASIKSIIKQFFFLKTQYLFYYNK